MKINRIFHNQKKDKLTPTELCILSFYEHENNGHSNLNIFPQKSDAYLESLKKTVIKLRERGYIK